MTIPCLRFITALLFATYCFPLFAEAPLEKTAKAEEKVTVIKARSIALKGTPAYPDDYPHWNYVNPNAPKGGMITYAAHGTYDNFNRFADRGNTPTGISALFDKLMVGNSDEISVLYGFIAESIEYASDYSWIIFNINKDARFQDGKHITAHDVAFSFNKFYTEGVPFFKRMIEGTKTEVINDYRVKFTIPNSNKNKMINLCDLTILPQHYYKDHNLKEPFKDVPLGSGPYKVGDYKMGQYIIYERVADYWAINHPAIKGTLNFDKIRYDYYLDETVRFEAFKKGEYDFRQENSSKNWSTQYVGKQFDNKEIVKETISHSIPQPTQAYVFNLQRPVFKDINVRKALNLLMDYEWTNKNLFYGLYNRNSSYFINTPYQATGLPTGRELEILKEFKDKLPKELFTQEFKVNKTDGSGKIRNEIRQALRLLKKAGYSLKNGKLVDKNNKQLEFEIIFYSTTMERVIVPFKANLEKAGIKMNMRLVSDISQYTNRLRDRDFDMTTSHLGGAPFPTGDLKIRWHSDYIDSTYNSTGVSDPVVDELVSRFELHDENHEELLALGRAFDRVLLWKYISIPQWHSSAFRIAYRNKFSRPDTSPKYDLGLETWWFDTKKAKSISQ